MDSAAASALSHLGHLLKRNRDCLVPIQLRTNRQQLRRVCPAKHRLVLHGSLRRDGHDGAKLQPGNIRGTGDFRLDELKSPLSARSSLHILEAPHSR